MYSLFKSSVPSLGYASFARSWTAVSEGVIIMAGHRKTLSIQTGVYNLYH